MRRRLQAMSINPSRLIVPCADRSAAVHLQRKHTSRNPEFMRESVRQNPRQFESQSIHRKIELIRFSVSPADNLPRLAECDAGRDLKSATCAFCADGTAADDSGVCQKCPAGEVSKYGAPCEPCSSGSFTADGVTCTACGDGFTVVGKACVKCPNDTPYSNAGGRCGADPLFSSAQMSVQSVRSACVYI